MKNADLFFASFFLIGIPLTIAALRPDSGLSVMMRLGILAVFVLCLIIIFRVYVLGVPEYQVFKF